MSAQEYVNLLNMLYDPIIITWIACFGGKIIRRHLGY